MSNDDRRVYSVQVEVMRSANSAFVSLDGTPGVGAIEGVSKFVLMRSPKKGSAVFAVMDGEGRVRGIEFFPASDILPKSLLE